MVSPALTTVHQPLVEMAEEAARILLRLRRSDQADARIEFGTRLVVRNSTAALEPEDDPAGGPVGESEPVPAEEAAGEARRGTPGE